jgi:hypothetical protein
MEILNARPKLSPKQLLVVLLFFAIGGGYCFYNGIQIHSYSSYPEFQARLTFVHIRRFSGIYHYTFITNKKLVEGETIAYNFGSYQVGDYISIYYKQKEGSSFIKDLVVPNTIMNYGLALIPWGLCVWGGVMLGKKARESRKDGPLGELNSTEDMTRPL